MKLLYVFGPIEDEFEYEVSYSDVVDHAAVFYATECGNGSREIIDCIKLLISNGIIDPEKDDNFIDYLTELYEGYALEKLRDSKRY